MYYLPEEKVDWILEDIRSQGLTYERLEGELLDHICCVVEEAMWEQEMAFEDAYQQTVTAFGQQGILKVQKDTIRLAQRRPFIHRITRLTTTIAACLILFIGVVVQAQERPDTHPLHRNLPVSLGFGKQIHPVLRNTRFHSGVDIKVPIGTKVFATASGQIIKAKHHKAWGWHIVIKHDEVYTTIYSHLSKLMVKPGQNIQKGDIIALTGNSGLSTRPHLHYEVQKNGSSVNPKKYFGK